MVGRRRRLSWTEAARSALQEAAGHIAADSPVAAQNFVERIISAASSLETLSERGRVVPELGDLSIRELIVPPFRLIYQVGEGDVFILTLLHEARDFARWQTGSSSEG